MGAAQPARPRPLPGAGRDRLSRRLHRAQRAVAADLPQALDDDRMPAKTAWAANEPDSYAPAAEKAAMEKEWEQTAARREQGQVAHVVRRDPQSGPFSGQDRYRRRSIAHADMGGGRRYQRLASGRDHLPHPLLRPEHRHGCWHQARPSSGCRKMAARTPQSRPLPGRRSGRSRADASSSADERPSTQSTSG